MRPRPQNRARAGDGRFKEGVSGNPGGRPKGLVKAIRSRTKDGLELVALMLRVLRDSKESTAHRMEAATWLADRAFGRPAQAVEHSGPEGASLPVILKWTDAA